jgi:hypothetical protein
MNNTRGMIHPEFAETEGGPSNLVVGTSPDAWESRISTSSEVVVKDGDEPTLPECRNLLSGVIQLPTRPLSEREWMLGACFGARRALNKG